MSNKTNPCNLTDEKIESLWRQFADTPITDDDEIDEGFYQWEKGTNRFEIWQWFDKQHSKGVQYLLENVH